ncbi:MAG: DUF5688 family protein [Eubacteriales bacterium]|nr:DUF5688 family protein [Eubacteriales bacterium]
MQIPKSSIFYQLRNYEKNKSWLTGVPHIRYLDMSIVFYYPVPQKEEEQVALVTNENIKNWQISVEELEELAAENTPKFHPLFFTALETLIQELCEECLMPQVQPDRSLPMYVLSNQKKLFGAAAILYPGALLQISRCLKDDLYVLPSSVHECILVPVNSVYTRAELENIVREVNENQVPDEDFLSNHIYFYSSQDDSLHS